MRDLTHAGGIFEIAVASEQNVMGEEQFPYIKCLEYEC